MLFTILYALKQCLTTMRKHRFAIGKTTGSRLRFTPLPRSRTHARPCLRTGYPAFIKVQLD